MGIRGIAQALAAVVVLGVGTHHYYAELYQFPQGGFPRSATLDLTVRENGTIIGYYRPTDGGISPVSGSVDGAKITLSIGGLDGMQVNGTITDGKIEGRAFRPFGRGEFSFIGRPIPNDNTLPRAHSSSRGIPPS
jgi:hypothetical protein